MKATELRIGNYYLAFGVDLKQVETLTKDKILIDFQPIPLTEEWLKKFGFEKVIVDSWYSKLAENKNTINISKSGLVAINDDKPIRSIEYCHQLQNLYFALTGEELTIKQ
jgi:hypothetical protein